MATPLEVNQIMIGLSAAFTDWKPTNLKATTEAYEEALRVYPYDLLKRAADRCRDVCLFFPKIAEIRKAINEIKTADVPNTSAAYMEKVPLSQEMEKYLNDFRQTMVMKGKWREARPHHDQECSRVFSRGEYGR